MKWAEIQAEAERVISLAKDDQFRGGQQLAEMVLEYRPPFWQPESTTESWQQTAAAIVSDDPNALRERLAELQGDDES